jgi:hypothetical protein
MYGVTIIWGCYALGSLTCATDHDRFMRYCATPLVFFPISDVAYHSCQLQFSPLKWWLSYLENVYGCGVPDMGRGYLYIYRETRFFENLECAELVNDG